MIDFSCGPNHCLARIHSKQEDEKSTLMSWGLNDEGRLGRGEGGEEEISFFPVPVQGEVGEKGGEGEGQVLAGGFHSLCVWEGKVYTWGCGKHGQLGNCQLKNEGLPHLVEGFGEGGEGRRGGEWAQGGAVEGFGTAVVTKGGNLYVWGFQMAPISHQLEYNRKVVSAVPRLLLRGRDVCMVAWGGGEGGGKCLVAVKGRIPGGEDDPIEID